MAASRRKVVTTAVCQVYLNASACSAENFDLFFVVSRSAQQYLELCNVIIQWCGFVSVSLMPLTLLTTRRDTLPPVSEWLDSPACGYLLCGLLWVLLLTSIYHINVVSTVCMHGGLFGKSRAGRSKHHFLTMRYLLRDAMPSGADGAPAPHHEQQRQQRRARAKMTDALVRDCLEFSDPHELCARYLSVRTGRQTTPMAARGRVDLRRLNPLSPSSVVGRLPTGTAAPVADVERRVASEPTDAPSAPTSPNQDVDQSVRSSAGELPPPTPCGSAARSFSSAERTGDGR
jgi:hypothetical protein